MARTADVEHYPDGRDHRCLGTLAEPGCGYSQPEDAPAHLCPECGRGLSRISMRTVHRPMAEARRF